MVCPLGCHILASEVKDKNSYLEHHNIKTRMANRRGAAEAAAVVGNGPVPAAPQPPQVIVMPPQVHVSTFYGGADDHGLLVEEFAMQLKALWRSCHLSNEQQLSSIMQYSGPDVRLEIRNLSEAIRQDPRRVLDELVKIFGDCRHPHELARSFYGQRQRQGEGVQLFANRLQRAYEKLVRREAALGEPETPAVRLRQQFIAGINDPSLQGTLGDKVTSNPELSFVEVRKVAIAWASYGTGPEEPARAAAVLPPFDVPARSAAVTPAAADPSAELVALRAEVAALTKLVKDNLVLPRSQLPASDDRSRGGKSCLYCGKSGHLEVECFKKKREERRAAQRQAQQGNGSAQL